MNIKRMIGMLCLGALLTGCTTQFVPYENDDVKLSFNPSISSGSEPYELSFKYSDTYFMEDAKNYNQNLAELSFASSVATGYKERGTQFFTDCGFEDFGKIFANQFKQHIHGAFGISVQ